MKHVAKVVFFVASREQLVKLAKKHALEHAYSSSVPGDSGLMVVAYPRHHHTRFALAEEPGVHVLPGANDPAEVGPVVAARMSHIHTEPTHTARQVLIRLREVHGAAFDPDT